MIADQFRNSICTDERHDVQVLVQVTSDRVILEYRLFKRLLLWLANGQ